MAGSRSVLALVAAVAGMVITTVYSRALPALSDRETLGRELEALFAARTRWLVQADLEDGGAYYDTSSRTGDWALDQERRRVASLRAWASARDIRLTGAEYEVRVVDSGVSENTAWGSVCYNLVLTYEYGDGSGSSQMGVRTIHWMELARRGDRWLVRRDWYWDPFGSSRATAGGRPAGHASSPATPGPDTPSLAPAAAIPVGAYNRQAAVRYADRYCGVRVSPGTGRYNPRYRDFTFAGGDCTNFVSQVLADREAGGMPTDEAWCYRGGSPTAAWVRADAFVRYMLNTGRATCLKRGRTADVASAVSELLPGDVIALEEKGTLEHLMVVVGKDSRGCVLVDSHSADRFHVPWDLGGGEDTVFWLLHVADRQDR